MRRGHSLLCTIKIIFIFSGTFINALLRAASLRNALLGVNKSVWMRDASQLWEKLSAALKPQVSADTFKRWFSAVELTKATEDRLTFVVPNNIYQFWIESNHMAALSPPSHVALGGPRTSPLPVLGGIGRR